MMAYRGLAGWAPGLAAHAAPEADARRPLLVTVDDLPIGPTRPHQDPAERRLKEAADAAASLLAKQVAA